MEKERQPLGDELLDGVSGGSDAWWPNDDPTIKYFCHKCGSIYYSGEAPEPCPNCGSTDVERRTGS